MPPFELIQAVPITLPTEKGQGAHELAQDALVIALEQWPRACIPDDPGPWLMATAKHHAIDLLRRQERYRTKLNLLGAMPRSGRSTHRRTWTPRWTTTSATICSA